MNIETETPHKIQTFEVIYFQNKVEWKYIHLEAKGDDRKLAFIGLGLRENISQSIRKSSTNINPFNKGLVFLTTMLPHWKARTTTTKNST